IRKCGFPLVLKSRKYGCNTQIKGILKYLQILESFRYKLFGICQPVLVQVRYSTGNSGNEERVLQITTNIAGIFRKRGQFFDEKCFSSFFEKPSSPLVHMSFKS
ncbi:unnamed protein product, partial [Owenia fusiformis]